MWIILYHEPCQVDDYVDELRAQLLLVEDLLENLCEFLLFVLRDVGEVVDYVRCTHL